MGKEKRKEKKSVYKKPQLLRVKLVANESVLTGCKSGGTGQEQDLVPALG